VRPAQLPAGAGRFVGREAQLQALSAALEYEANPRIGVLHGPPGVGKTTLAVHWAHQHREEFEDGQLFADLRGHSPNRSPADPAEILEEFLIALGLSPSDLPGNTEERAALFRSIISGRRILVVLDGAWSSGQVKPLLPGSSEALVLITTRALLTGLAVRHGANQVQLEPFEPSEALCLLRGVVGDARVDREPEAAQAVVERCGYLPLAVALAAERIAPHSLTLADLAIELAEERKRLSTLTALDDDETAIRAVFSWSYRALQPEPARMFRLLGLHAGRDISVPAAAALADVTEDQASTLLRSLGASHLVEESRRQRFVLHDLLHLYATEQVQADESAQTREIATLRELTWYVTTAENAGNMLAPYERDDSGQAAALTTYSGALDWCEAELRNFVPIVTLAMRARQERLAWRLAQALFPYFHLRKPWSVWEVTYQLGRSAARSTGDPSAEALMEQGLGLVHLGLGDHDNALEKFERSLKLLAGQDNPPGEAWGWVGVGLAQAGSRQLGAARESLEQGLRIQRTSQDIHGQAVTSMHLADVCREQGQPQDAADYATHALGIFRSIGDSYGEGLALQQAGKAAAAAGDVSTAVSILRAAQQVHYAAHDDKGEADTLSALSRLLHSSGDALAARESLRRAAAIFDQRGDRASLEVHARLTYLEELTNPADEQPGGTDQ
jgi:tetratricopeptide (TPR) repeat protein